MRIDLVVTTLWAELAPWSTSAAEVILRPEYWAVHGATRMGKAVTPNDRLEASALEASALELGLARSHAMMGVLVKADRAARAWSEPTPPHVRTNDEIRRALEGARVAEITMDALERLAELGHVLQAGAPLARDASLDDVRLALGTAPRVAPKPSGSFSGLLAAGLGTLWVPTPLASAWDSPACVIASSAQLATDLAALPTCLRARSEAGELTSLCALVVALERALEQAGPTHSIHVAG